MMAEMGARFDVKRFSQSSVHPGTSHAEPKPCGHRSRWSVQDGHAKSSEPVGTCSSMYPPLRFPLRHKLYKYLVSEMTWWFAVKYERGPERQ